MLEIEIAHHSSAWGPDGLVPALADIASVGFKGIETGSDEVTKFEDRPAVFNEMLAQHDISFVGISACMGQLIGADMDEEVERAVNYARFLKATGARVLTLGAPEGPASPVTDELLPRLLAALDEIGRRALDLGVTVCLHPALGSLCETAREIARFMEGTDARSLFLCPDIGHLVAASIQPEKFVETYASRIRHMHWKDYRPRKKARKAAGKGGTVKAPKAEAERRAQSFAELGKGTVDFRKLVRALNKTGYKGWITIEIERPAKSPKESAAASFAYTEKALGLLI
ncbi:MAG: sugar phosphate isomerase/epimerase [Planctomycetota bacterium]|nr:sugar phosphate isomerase/epimerase [Planctomycetota bacterium]